MFLEIFEFQEQHRCEFFEAISAIIGPKLANELYEIYCIQRPNLLDLMPASIETQVERPIQISASESAEWKFPELSNESDIDADLLVDFLESFDDENKSLFETTIMSIKNKSDSQLEASIALLYRDFHSIKGSARFCNLRVFEKVTHELEELISLSQGIYNKLDASVRFLIEEALLGGVDVLWHLKIIIENHKSEIQCQYDSEWLFKVNKLVISINEAEQSVLEVLSQQSTEEFLTRF